MVPEVAFGDKFDEDKVETGSVDYQVNVIPPASAWNNPNVTLYFEIDKLSLQDLSIGSDDFFVTELGYMDADSTLVSTNYTPPEEVYYTVELERFQVLLSDVRKQKIQKMPGFRFTWHYFGTEVELEDLFDNNAFVRKGFIS